MAKIMEINPNKETIGPTVILRKLYTSGLNSLMVVDPVINAKPKMIMANPTAIKIRLVLPKVKCLLSSIYINY